MRPGEFGERIHTAKADLTPLPRDLSDDDLRQHVADLRAERAELRSLLRELAAMAAHEDRFTRGEVVDAVARAQDLLGGAL